MNRYPLWKYAIILVTLLVAVIYTLPNFYDEAPAVQVSAGKVTAKVDNGTLDRVESALKAANLTPNQLALEGTSVLARFDSTDEQIKAKDAIELSVNPDAADPT